MSCIQKDLNLIHNVKSSMPYKKYKPWNEYIFGLPHDKLWPERKWPKNKLFRAPRWCSVDLRDGNQALINPMRVEQKLRYFRLLVKMGFKEIEVGFPAASQLDYDFVRLLIEKEFLPDDLWLMVLVPARDNLIERTIESLKGAKNVIIHLYNSTSELQRRIVFQLSKCKIKDLAVNGTILIKDLITKHLSNVNVRFQYSPESFTGTEVEFALEVCEAVINVWKPTEKNPMILNLPETVQNSPSNFYADQIEWMHTHLGSKRSKLKISSHPHNDRGTGVASAELALLAGADRVEGCLFGNGERTGNVCLITLALNLMHLGIDPEMELNNISEIIDIYRECTGFQIPSRHPWVGELVYTAFSGSHQDAIKKGFSHFNNNQDIWEVPYLPIDPRDIGRSYETTVRINSQSGKGGIAFVMEQEFGIHLPREVQIELSQYVKSYCDITAKEIMPKQVLEIFEEVFIKKPKLFSLTSFSVQVYTTTCTDDNCTSHTSVGTDQNEDDDYVCSKSESKLDTCQIEEIIGFSGRIAFSEMMSKTKKVDVVSINGSGNGPINAFVNALSCEQILSKFGASKVKDGAAFEVFDYAEEAIESGSQAEAICIIKVKCPWEESALWGAARHTNTTTASFHAILNAINRAVKTI